MDKTWALADVVSRSVDVAEPPDLAPIAPFPPLAGGPSPVPGQPDFRALTVFLGLGMAGLVMMLAGLALDAVIHARDPGLAHVERGVFTLANPGHAVLLAGGILAAVGLTGATVGALSLSSGRFLSSRRTATALVATVVVLAAGTAGALSWSTTAQPPIATGPLAPAQGPDVHGIGIVSSHAPGPCRPTAAEKRGAAKLISDTEIATAKYRTFEAAAADGYVGPANPTLTEHYSNAAYTLDGRVLDPEKPESLLYTPTSHGMVLTAVMYMMNVPGEFGPEPGGCLTRWHVHNNVCFWATTFEIAGLLQKAGDACPVGQFRYVPPPVLHVWFVDVPGGRFAAEVDAQVLAKAVGP